MPTHDAASLEVVFVPNKPTIQVGYQFGSDEYDEYVGQFNDGFAIFLNDQPLQFCGVGPVVGVGTINLSLNSALYQDNPVGSGNLNIQYDGMTRPIQVGIPVTVGTQTKLRFVIADVNDGALDSSVFITAAPSPILSGGLISGNDFHFTISGAVGAQVNVEATADFVTWTSLGQVTLTGGSYNFVDSGAVLLGHRFYAAIEGNTSSANTYGFVNVNIPASSTNMVANQLNNAAGNTFGVVLAGLPTAITTKVLKWNLSTQNYSSFTRVPFGNHWSPSTGANVSLNPGEGAFIENGATTGYTVSFIGDVP